MKNHALLLLLLPLLAACPQVEPPLVLPNTGPEINLLSPEPPPDGDVILQLGEALEVRARVRDSEDAATDLVITWSGVRTDATADPLELGTSTPDTEGISDHVIGGLQTGAWRITATVADTDGAESQASLPVIVEGEDLPPTALITAPATGSTHVGDEDVVFNGTALDDRGLDAIAVEWFSSRDGVLSTAPPSTQGLLAFSAPLSVGEHTVTLTVTDGAEQATTDTVTFEVEPPDTAPSAPTVTINPAAPVTDDDLTCIITSPSVDPEGLPTTPIYTWLRDGAPTPWATDVLPSLETARGEQWTCEVRGNDGTLSSEPGSASVTVGNTAPTVDSASLSPNPAFETSTLTCVPDGFADIDGDTEDYTWAWEVNGSPVVGATDGWLDGADFDRDDLVACLVTPFDGTDAGTTIPSAPLFIDNSVPTPPTVTLTPSPTAAVQSALNCAHTTSSDADPGDLVGYEFEWDLNGVHQPAWDNLPSVPASATALGEQWTCRVRAGDGTDASAWVSASTDVLPAAGDVVITEYLPDPGFVSDAAGEWIELYNNSGTALDLMGFELHDDGTDSHTISSSVVLPVGGRLVLGRNDDSTSNGGVAVGYEYSGFTLDNVDQIVVSFGALEIDRVEYDRSFWGGDVGHSISLDPALGAPDDLANDAPASWCGSMIPLGGPGSDFGTPGLVNDSCACWPTDDDGDGYGDDATCSVYDCDDADASINPAGVDVCENGIDEDCSGADGLCSCAATDSDGDGFGTGAACSPLDCDDANTAVFPGAGEICNGIDDDCDGAFDEGFDADGDGWTTCDGDCADGNPNINPGATEACNSFDDDCDGLADEGFDNDSDGWSTCNSDCDDGDAAINPGATDVCGGGDQDCDGTVDEDAAGDQYEPNANAAQAAFISGDDTSVTIFGTVHTSGDAADWFWVDTEDDLDFPCDLFQVSATLDSIPSGTDYDLYLYDNDENLLDWSTNVGNASESVSWSPGCVSPGDDAGVFFVRVRRWSGQSCSDTYRLVVSNAG